MARTRVPGTEGARAYVAFLAEHGREPSKRAGAGTAEARLADWITRARTGGASREALHLLDVAIPGWALPRNAGITVEMWTMIRRVRTARSNATVDAGADRWLDTRRRQHAAGTLDAALSAILDDQLGAQWSRHLTGDERAELWALRVAAFRYRHGHLPRQVTPAVTASPRSPDEIPLARWLYQARDRVRQGTLAEHRMTLITGVLGDGWQGRRRRPRP